MFYKGLLVVAACLSTVNSSPRLFDRGVTFNYNNDKVRGVNLGGWFVLEPWITPKIFTDLPADLPGRDQVVDEYTYTQKLGKSAALARLKQHWDTWITESDFKEIKSVGLNHVRIPVGYWALAPRDGDPYVQGQLPYLDRAVKWASNAGLKVMLDLHGAPGSQNGFDNSGKYGSIDWISGGNAPQTLLALKNLASRYASSSGTVTSIELLNEPANWGNPTSAIKDFYTNGLPTIRNVNPNTAIVIHDAFLPVDQWNGFMGAGSGAENVILDTHIYQIFSPDEVALSPCDHVSRACSQGPKLAATDKWTVVGEWTGAQTDCAKWLNGLGKGARYDGTFPDSFYVGDCKGKYEGTVAGMSDVDKRNMEYYIEAQLDAYESHSGWVFWTWKTQSAPEWNFRDLVREGIVPQPLTSRKHPGQCQSSQCMVPGK